MAFSQKEFNDGMRAAGRGEGVGKNASESKKQGNAAGKAQNK